MSELGVCEYKAVKSVYRLMERPAVHTKTSLGGSSGCLMVKAARWDGLSECVSMFTEAGSFCGLETHPTWRWVCNGAV